MPLWGKRPESLNHAWLELDLFKNMAPEAIREVVSRLTRVTFDADELILREGDEGNALFLLEEGHVHIEVSADSSGDTFVSALEAPAIFGEMSLLTGVPRTASVVAQGPVVCYRMAGEDLDYFMARETSIGRHMTRVVGERLMEAQTIRQVGKYEVKGRIGAGSAATVFSAIHPELGTEVALKMLSHSLVHRPGFMERFQEEARIVANMTHEHIVRVHDTELAYGTQFIVMERLKGIQLEDIVEGQTRLAWGAIRRILKEVCLALDYSHKRGLLHRDIKPSNIFLTEDRRVKLLDFGIAVPVELSAEEEGTLMGTPYYMSPEQVRSEPLDARTDLYGLGIVAYELATGYVPFHADSLEELLVCHTDTPLPDPLQLVPDIPEDLVEFIVTATAKDPADRFKDCGVAAQFLKTASELPLVHQLELSTVAITYHPSRRQVVAEALQTLQGTLDGTAGISMLWGHQASTPEAED